MDFVWARQFPRFEYRAPVQLTARGDQQAIAAETFNLSQGGMFAGVQKPLPVGSEVCCDLNLDGRPRSLWGRVAWTRDQPGKMSKLATGMGIAFEPPSQTEGMPLSEPASQTPSENAAGDSVPDWTDDTERIRAPMLDPSDIAPSIARNRTGRIWLVVTPCVAAIVAALVSAALMWQPGLMQQIKTAPATLQKALAGLATPRVSRAEPSTRPVTVKQAPLSPSAPVAALSAPEPAVAEESSGPQVTSTGSRVEVAIPVAGSFEQMVYHRLANPDGVLINLPNVRPRLDFGRYPINRLGIRRLWIRRYQGGTQMRIMAVDEFRSYTVTAEPGWIRVAIEMQ